jgi:orotate phosphoribosyltransferase
MKLTRKHVVLSFLFGGMRHLILSQEGDAHMQDARIGVVELLTLEELSKFLKNKIKRNKNKNKIKREKSKNDR